jgi:hypothetical protein
VVKGRQLDDGRWKIKVGLIFRRTIPADVFEKEYERA